MSTWLIIWIIGAMFTDGLKDPENKGGVGEGFKRFFQWPWELGQFASNQHTGSGDVP